MELLLLLQLSMVVLLRRRRRPRAWTPTPLAMAGRWMRPQCTVRIDAPALYEIFNPTGLVGEWTMDEVGRVWLMLW